MTVLNVLPLPPGETAALSLAQWGEGTWIEKLEACPEGFKKLPGSPDDKFKISAEEVREGKEPGATSLRHTFQLRK